MSTAPRRQISTRRKVAFATVLVVCLLLACEGAIRVRAWMRYGSAAAAIRDPMLTYDPVANLYVPQPGYAVKGALINIHINSLGFRGDEITRSKPANTTRIVCLGASTTFNTEVSSNHATWPHRLQEKLQQAYPGSKFEVINAAVGGYVASENLKNLRYRVLPLDPDLVIYYEANNDVVKDTQELAARQGLIQKKGPSFVSALSKYSLLFDIVYKNLAIRTRSRDTGAGRIDRIPRDLPNRFIGLLDEMRTELAKRDVTFMLSTFITKNRRNQDRPTQIANAEVAFYYMPWMSIDGMMDAMDVYNQAILDYAAQQHLPVVDDRESIPADGKHFSDWVHLLDAGADAMADRFARALRQSGVIDRLVAKTRTAAATVRSPGAVIHAPF